MNLDFYNLMVGQLVLITEIIAVIGLLFLIFGKNNKWAKEIGKNYEVIVFIFALASMLGSLTYSEIIGFIPCKLCWIQRVCMFPIAILSFVALVSKTPLKPRFYLSLAVPGFTVAFYHAFSQLTGRALECGVIGQSASCGDVWVKMFGYMTIPVMAGTGFAIIIIANLYKILRGKN